MSRRVVIIGAGMAGLAAAWSAKREGREVTLVSRGPGASALATGAIDDHPWETLLHASRNLDLDLRPHPLAPDIAKFAGDLAIFDIQEHALAWLATSAGRLRPARGRDRSLLDLGKLEDTGVLLPRVDRAGWDADLLARGLEDDPIARARRLTFSAIDLPVIRFDDERRIADGDLALRHDDKSRLAWLASRLREALHRDGMNRAFLLGPWLGACAPQAELLSKLVGVPVGEVLIGAGSPAGLRFEAARDRLLTAIGARVILDRATALETDDEGRLSVQLAQGTKALRADGIVLAVGGLVGGGLTYAPAERGAGTDLPTRGKVPFSLSLRADLTLAAQLSAAPSGAKPQRLDHTSSMHGPALDLIAWPVDGDQSALESVGLLCEGVLAAPRIMAAGEVIAGRPRTLIEAARSGLRAGREA